MLTFTLICEIVVSLIIQKSDNQNFHETLFLYLCELNGEELFAVIYIYKMKREVMWNRCKLFAVFYIQNRKREVAEELGGI